VVSLTSFKDANVPNADVLLPIAPFTETAGSFVNAEGRLQTFTAWCKPLGDARPAWKVLRVLGNLLAWTASTQETTDEVRAEALGDLAKLAARLDNGTSAAIAVAASGRWPAARGRRADLRHRCARAPRAVAAADGRRQADAAGQPAVGAVAATGPGRR
jgi:NADH-quinone oxidoreductase subunit G